MKKSILCFVTITLIMTCGAFAGDKSINIAIEGAYAPFNYLDQQGTPQGFEVELVQALCSLMGRDYKFTVLDWDGIIPGLLAKKVDAVAASMSITEERKKSVAFTQKYYEESGSFIAAKGSSLKVSKTGLKGKRIGVQRATTWSSYIEGAYPEAKVVYYDEIDRGLLDLVANRVDAILSQSYHMSLWLQKKEGENFTAFGKPVRDRQYIGEGIGIALRKSDTLLQQQFNTAIDTILKNGTYQKIASKYFDFDIYGFEN
jgi:lysine-arginine-ornithine-binding protein